MRSWSTFLATQLASTEHVLNRSEANRFISAHNLTVWTVEPQETTMNVIRMLTAVGSYDKLESCLLYWRLSMWGGSTTEHYDEYLKVFRALSDRTRLEILSLLNDGEKCACKLLEKLSISQPTLSHHMKILCDSGLVKSRNEGKWVHYSIDSAGFALAQQFLGQLSRFDIADPVCCSKSSTT